MLKSWQGMGNSYLRLVSSLQEDPNKRMSICTQSESELQLVLEAATQFKTSTTIGEVVIEVMRYKSRPGGVVDLCIDVSKEMS